MDALRGAAAMMVVRFHYTTRYDEQYIHTTPLDFAVPLGHLGVNLFFLISGFVIFMTLERTTKPFDFVVSRFSRLHPAYWAAVLVTFAITTLWGLPGKDVSPWTALANSMRRVMPLHSARKRLTWPLGIVLGLIGFAVVGKAIPIRDYGVPQGTAELAGVQPAKGVETECTRVGEEAPIVLLVFGQSNAASHGEMALPSRRAVAFAEGRCYLTEEPLPGATGAGAAIWPRLACTLEQQAICATATATSAKRGPKPLPMRGPKRYGLAS